MPKMTLLDAHVTVNGVDLSDHVKKVDIDYGAELPDATTMGATSRGRLGGLKDFSISIEFTNDYVAASVDATLFPIVGTLVTVVVRPNKTNGVSASNPNYSGACLLEKYAPVAGSVGDVLMAPAVFQGSGPLSRLTA